MISDVLKTLFHPFETEMLAAPAEGARTLFLGAEPGFRLPEGWGGAIDAIQGFRPDFLGLERAGHALTPRAEGTGYDMALILAGRHRGQNELRIAEAMERTAAGALIVVAGSKDDGVASLRKRLGELIELEGSLPKYHGIAFWFRVPAEAASVMKPLRAANPALLVEGRFHTAPGMFSFDRVDPGSRLLAENLPKLSGQVADFCAGWGYLSAEILRRIPEIAALDLYEADYDALEAAKANIRPARFQPGFFWTDLLREQVTRRYDAIVMNPPFHRGRATEPEIGAGMIRAAAKALKGGGRLVMVANRRLPYEAVVSASFANCAEIAGDSSFKVLTARR
ncbi:methyltransferase [Mesorhizobium sp. Root554]|nr:MULTISPECIES: class I SAM-dependent methyltransferase [unclassified Mesorhizobium]KQZ12781.1 methyltransferase [Mesorhizobium sp. Root1471]KQZ38243.1 methyltransferase [Mesorhizobium sp. Root554]